MTKNIVTLIIVALLIVGTISIFSTPKGGDTGKIRIGALLSLTGGASAWGENAQKGIELAVKSINDKGGINGRQVEMVYLDTGSEPKKSLSVFQQAVSIEKVDAIIGPLNQTEVASVIPAIEKAQIPTIIPGYIPVQNRKNLHNPLIVWMDAEDEAGQMAQYVYKQGIRKVAVIGSLDSWESTVSNAFAAKFKEIGGIVTNQETVQPDTEDMKLPVTRVIQSKPEAVFLGTYYQFVNSTKELANLGYTGKLYGIEIDEYLAGETFGVSKGLEFIAPDFYSTDFVENFKKLHAITPGMPAGQAYDATNLLFSLLQKSTDTKEVLEYMKNTKEYTGVSGALHISEDGRTKLPTAIFMIGDTGVISRVSSYE